MVHEKVVKKKKPTVLLGLSGCHGLFSRDVLKAMAEQNDRPIIFPLSNPTHLAECTNVEALEASDGRCIFASGSPFDPVRYNGKTYIPSQCNNMFIFPGLGLGAVLSQSRVVSEKMIYASSVAVATDLSQEECDRGMVFPDIERIREVSHSVACKVIKQAREEGICLNTELLDMDDQQLDDYITRKMYDPVYVPLAYQRP